MDSREYWFKREQEHADRLRKSVSDKTDEIMREYKKTLADIEADINRNFVRYAKDGNMTMQEAMKLADKMDVERFADKAKEYVKNMDDSPQAYADLKLYNLKMRVSRLKLLQSEINLEIDKLSGKFNKETYEHLRKVTLDEYKRQAGILGESLKFDEKKVKHLVNASYRIGNGYTTFSDNIWNNTERLKAKLGSVLNSAILQGKNPNQFIAEFKKIFGAQAYQIGRLLITETARIQGDVQLDSYKQGGIEWYDISFESGACKICKRAASGGPYRHDRAVVGYNMYPFHPNCLCSIMPAEIMSEKERHALNRYISSESYTLNNMLRYYPNMLTDDQKEMVRYLDDALDKLPKYSGRLQRDYFFETADDLRNFAKNFKIGEIFSDNAYLSTSKIHYGENQEQLHFEILNSKTGRDISKYNENEQEVLFKRDTPFRILRTYYNDKGIPTVDLEEIINDKEDR